MLYLNTFIVLCHCRIANYKQKRWWSPETDLITDTDHMVFQIYFYSYAAFGNIKAGVPFFISQYCVSIHNIVTGEPDEDGENPTHLSASMASHPIYIVIESLYLIRVLPVTSQLCDNKYIPGIAPPSVPWGNIYFLIFFLSFIQYIYFYWNCP